MTKLNIHSYIIVFLISLFSNTNLSLKEQRVLIEGWVKEYESNLKKRDFYTDKLFPLYVLLDYIGPFDFADALYKKKYYLDLTYKLLLNNIDLNPYLQNILRINPDIYTIVKYQPNSYDIICSEFENIKQYRAALVSLNNSLEVILTAYKKGTWEGVVSSSSPLYNTNIILSSRHINCLKNLYSMLLKRYFSKDGRYKGKNKDSVFVKSLCRTYYELEGNKANKYLKEILIFNIKSEIDSIKDIHSNPFISEKICNLHLVLLDNLYELASYFKKGSLATIKECVKLKYLGLKDKEYIKYLEKSIINNKEIITPYYYLNLNSENKSGDPLRGRSASDGIGQMDELK